MLYERFRLEHRLALFEQLALHTLAVQDEDTFRVAVLIGDDLPEWCRTRLALLIAEFPQAQIVALRRRPHYQALCHAYAELPNDPGATHVARFRLDDDDALHRSATRHVRDTATAMLEAGHFKQPFAIGVNRGLYLDLNGPEKAVSEWYEKTPPSPGLTVVAPIADRINCYRYNHRRIGQHMNCYTEISQPMYLRSVHNHNHNHNHNDSMATATGPKGGLKPIGITRMLRRGFAMGDDHFKGL